MKIFDKIKNKITKYKKIRKLKHAKYIHLMFNDKFNVPLVNFINKYFDTSEHFFLCKRSFKEFSMPVGDNVLEVRTYKKDYWKKLKFDKIICHSLFDGEIVDILYNNKEWLSKAYWGIWGGDLYEAPRDKKNDYVRSHFKGYLTVPDRQETIARYGTNNNFFETFAIFPINKEMLDNVVLDNHNYIQIQINNSCDKSTLEVLDSLSRFKNENIKLCTILSYGDLTYKDVILQKGKEIYGDKFFAILDYLSPQDYVNHLASNDIMIFNQNRQQGGGNILASLYLGKKIFIKKEISEFKHLVEIDNIIIYDTNLIKIMEFNELIDNSTEEINKKNVKKYFDESYIKKTWDIVFND